MALSKIIQSSLRLITVVAIVYSAHGQQGILESDPSLGSDTYRVYRYTDTIFSNYDFYQKTKMYLDDSIRLRYDFDRCEFKGSTSIYSQWKIGKKNRSGRLDLSNSKVEEMSLRGSFSGVFERDTISRLLVSGHRGSMIFKKSKVGLIAIALDTLDGIQTYDSISRINRIMVYSSYVGELAIGYLPDTLELINLEISKPLNFKRFKRNNRIHYLRTSANDIDKLDFEYHNFRLYFRGDESYDGIIGVYTALLESFRRKGYSSSYEKLDKEFLEFKYTHSGIIGRIQNWFTKNWWDYGYSRHLIFRNSICLNLIFFLLNILCFEKLINEVYRIRKFVLINSHLNRKYPINSVKRFWYKLPYIFIYTSFIFWGLKLDFDKLGIQKIGMLFWVIFQYIVGFVCLAYLANYIITI
ncbi:MAG: hypothetical protein RH948_02880 [Cyclobacteriaceae bacterium]